MDFCSHFKLEFKALHSNVFCGPQSWYAKCENNQWSIKSPHPLQSFLESVLEFP